MTKVSYEDVFYPSADGRLRLFARDYPARESAKASALLMMHGLTRNSADFEPLIEALSQDSEIPRQRIIVPDQRGRGLSDYDPEPESYRPDVYVEDMWALLDHLSIDRVTCIGTSMGGLMAMIMAVQRPQRIASIVLNDVGPDVGERGLARIRSYVQPSAPLANWDEAANRCAQINGDVFPDFGPDDWDAFARRTCRKGSDGAIDFAYDPAISQGFASHDAPEASAEAAPDLWPLWDALGDTAVTVLRGENSDILEPATLAKMSARHKRGITRVTVQKRGHAPLLDETEAVAAISEHLKVCRG